MFENLTESGGTMGQHAWMANVLLDMAAYAEKNGLAELHAQLCSVVSTALTGDLAGALTPMFQSPPELRKKRDNLVHLDVVRRQLA